MNASHSLSLRLANNRVSGSIKIPAKGLKHDISRSFFIKLRRNFSIFGGTLVGHYCRFLTTRLSVLVITIHSWANSKQLIDQSEHALYFCYVIIYQWLLSLETCACAHIEKLTSLVPSRNQGDGRYIVS